MFAFQGDRAERVTLPGIRQPEKGLTPRKRANIGREMHDRHTSWMKAHMAWLLMSLARRSRAENQSASSTVAYRGSTMLRTAILGPPAAPTINSSRTEVRQVAGCMPAGLGLRPT